MSQTVNVYQAGYYDTIYQVLMFLLSKKIYITVDH